MSNKNFRTPLSRVKGLGSAKEGTDHFWKQRVSGVASTFLTVFLIYTVIRHVGSDYAAVKAYLKNPLVTIAMLLMLISFAVHMRIGMQVIIEDYVHSEGCKIMLLMFNTFFSIVVALAGIFAVLKLGFGA